MLPPVFLLRIAILHPRGGERIVSALPTDRVLDVIARALADAGVEPDADTSWELCFVADPLPNDRPISSLIPLGAIPTPLTLRPAAATAPSVALDFTDILLRKKIVSRDQLEDARQLAHSTGIKLHHSIVKLSYATPTEVMSAVAEQFGMQFVDLAELEIPKAVIELVPESVARENLVLPLSLEGNTLKVITADPGNFDTIQKLQFILNKDIVPVLAVQEQIQEAINRNYGQTETESVDSMLREFTDTAIDFTKTDSMSAPPPGGAAPTPADTRADEDDELDDEDEFDVLDDDEDEEDGEAAEPDFEIPPPPPHASAPVVAAPPAPVAAPAPASAPAPLARAKQEEDEPRSRVAAPRTRQKAASSVGPVTGRRLTERRATVRYYSRMNPDRVFPLLVMLTREEVEKVVKRHVEQMATGPLKIEKDTPLEIEPVLPGCVCHPPQITTKLDSKDQVFTFHVVPHVLGTVTGARVLIRQDHQPLAEIELDIRVVQRTMVLVSGLSALVLPTASAVMNHFGIDFTPKDGSNPYLSAMKFLFGEVTPAVMMAALVALTGVLYWFTRPKGRDVFWDINTKPPESKPAG